MTNAHFKSQKSAKWGILKGRRNKEQVQNIEDSYKYDKYYLTYNNNFKYEWSDKNEWITDMFSNMDECQKHAKRKKSYKKTTFLEISNYINGVKMKLHACFYRWYFLKVFKWMSFKLSDEFLCSFLCYSLENWLCHPLECLTIVQK